MKATMFEQERIYTMKLTGTREEFERLREGVRHLIDPAKPLAPTGPIVFGTVADAIRNFFKAEAE